MAALVSFGDILSLANLAWTIANILRESTGSSTDYQDLVAELDSLGTALQSLNQFLSNPGPVKLQLSVENALKFALFKCQTLMSGFLKKVEGYQHSLKKGGSGNSVRDSWRKIGWGLFKKDEIKTLRMQLMDQKSTINMLLALSHCTILERVEKATKHQQVTLAAMQYSMQRLPRSLGYTWEGENNHKAIWFIDAVGNRLPIPIELCVTRATFEGLLRVYFKNRAGNKYIQQAHYELAEEANGEVLGIKDWDDHIRPGMTITTRMIYVQWDNLLQGEVCPSCQRAIPMQGVSGFICSFCGTSVRDYTHFQDQFPARKSITFNPEPGPADTTPAADEPFIRRFLVRKAGARSAYSPGERVSYLDGLGKTVYAVVKRFGLMVQEGTLVYKVQCEPDGAHMCLPSTILRPVRVGAS